MSFPSRFPGRCEACGQAFAAGTRIESCPGVYGTFQHAWPAECRSARLDALEAKAIASTVGPGQWIANGVAHGSLAQELADELRERLGV